MIQNGQIIGENGSKMPGQSQKRVWMLWNAFRYLWIVDRARKRVKTHGNDWGNGEMAGNGARGQE